MSYKTYKRSNQIFRLCLLNQQSDLSIFLVSLPTTHFVSLIPPEVSFRISGDIIAKKLTGKFASTATNLELTIRLGSWSLVLFQYQSMQRSFTYYCYIWKLTSLSISVKWHLWRWKLLNSIIGRNSLTTFDSKILKETRKY